MLFCKCKSVRPCPICAGKSWWLILSIWLLFKYKITRECNGYNAVVGTWRRMFPAKESSSKDPGNGGRVMCTLFHIVDLFEYTCHLFILDTSKGSISKRTLALHMYFSVHVWVDASFNFMAYHYFPLPSRSRGNTQPNTAGTKGTSLPTAKSLEVTGKKGCSGVAVLLNDVNTSSRFFSWLIKEWNPIVVSSAADTVCHSNMLFDDP